MDGGTLKDSIYMPNRRNFTSCNSVENYLQQATLCMDTLYWNEKNYILIFKHLIGIISIC